jgi:hypothetical protein
MYIYVYTCMWCMYVLLGRENHQIYGLIWCLYMVLANTTCTFFFLLEMPPVVEPCTYILTGLARTGHIPYMTVDFGKFHAIKILCIPYIQGSGQSYIFMHGSGQPYVHSPTYSCIILANPMYRT